MGGRPKVVITEPMPLVEEEKKLLQKYADVFVCPKPTPEVVREYSRDADVLMVVYFRVTADIIEGSKRLKGIVRYGVGVDNVDLKAATENGVVVANVPDYATNAVADFTLALILAISRKIVQANEVMKQKQWGTWTSPPTRVMGFELSGKTLGLIGLGKIGLAVAKRAQAFGMTTIGFDPYVAEKTANESGVKLVLLDELLGSSDIISLHAPLTQETRNIINRETISKMKKGVVIVNTARGGLIDIDALEEALSTGRVAAAALDVYPNEPPDMSHPLFKHENLLLSPHIAWFTKEALSRLEFTAAQHAIDIINGKVPSAVANPEVLKRRLRLNG